MLVKGVPGEETNLELHQQEVRKVQRLKDIKETPQETQASKVNDLQEAVKQDPPCSSDKLNTICYIINIPVQTVSGYTQ